MFDNLERVPISKMNFNQLRERVQILQDRYDTLIRRYPELAGAASSSSEGIDWANIVTPLINATVNRLKFTAVLNSANTIEIYAEPPTDKKAFINPDGEPITDAEGNILVLDKTMIYRYVGTDESGNEYVNFWYWNGNEWKSAQRGFKSEFNQTPAGFQLEGTLELKTDTAGRVTISDSFIKMYPDNSGQPTYDAKVQIGYDDSSDYKYPVIILGAGAGATYAAGEQARDSNYTNENGEPTDKDGNLLEGQFKTVLVGVDKYEIDENGKVIGAVGGYPVRYGQVIIYKTATSLIYGAVGDDGAVNYIELKAYQNTEADPKTNYGETDNKWYFYEPGVYYFKEEYNSSSGQWEKHRYELAKRSITYVKPEA